MSDASIEGKREGSAARMIVGWVSEAASPAFVATLIWAACVVSFVVWHADYRSFSAFCVRDDAALLHTDKIIAEGAKPGRDFYYHYGLLPLLVSRGVFALAGRSPLATQFFLAMLFAVFCAGLTRVLQTFPMTRLGAILVAITAVHATQQHVPTHVMEAAMLIWAVAFRLQGRNASALALASLAIFVKISMPVVVTALLIGFVVLDALRERRARPLGALVAVPASLAVGALLCGGTLGWAGLRESLDPSSGAVLYRTADFGFFREGRHFWAPAGHTAFWYIGTIAGVWLVGTLVLAIRAVRSAPRIVAVVSRGAEPDTAFVAAEMAVFAAAAHFAFILVFFGPSGGGVYYYTWILVIGLSPWLGRARLEPSHAGVQSYGPALGWLGVGLALAASFWSPIRSLVTLAREPRTRLGAVTAPVDEAEEWNQAITVAHSIGGGSIAVVATAPCFELIDPTMREGRYWMIVPGQARSPGLDETVRLAESSDAIFVPKDNYESLVQIPELRSILEDAEPVHDGRYFLVLKPRPASPRAL